MFMLRYIHKRGEKIMILWTIQDYRAWESAQQAGILRTDTTYIEADKFASQAMMAYKWLVEQMEQRIGSKPSGVEFPIWAWYQWNNDRQRKPDLRSSGHLQRGQKGVRIEFGIDDQQVLLSDFDLWHYALNYWYLSLNEQEDMAFEAELEAHGFSFYEMKPLPHTAYHQRILDGWQRIFDLDWHDETGYISENRKKDKSIQATLWELPLAHIRKVTTFIAR